MTEKKWIKSFNEINSRDIVLVGGKASNLGELTRAGFPVPAGFCITTEAYGYFLRQTGNHSRIEDLIRSVDQDSASRISKQISDIISGWENGWATR